MSYLQEFQRLAEQHAQAALDVEARGKRDGFDARKDAAEETDLALICLRAVADLAGMAPAEQQDYAHRLKAALWQRQDDSPEVRINREDPL